MFRQVFAKQSQDQYLSILKELKKGRPRELRDIQKEYGLDGALHYFYLKQSAQTTVKNFRKTLEIFKTEYKEGHKNYQLLIVAPPQGMARKWSQDQLHYLTKLTRDSGFTRCEIFHESATSVIDGSLQLRETIKKLSVKKRPILLLSFSHGSAIARLAIDQLEKHELRSVIGWINFSGLVFGSPHYTCPKREPLFNKAAGKLLRSFSYEQRYFLKAVEDKNIPIISFLGCQPSTIMPRKQTRAYRRLSVWGPNDGLVPFCDYERMPGVVVPIWGQMHYFDFLIMRSILQRTLCYLTSKSQISGDHQWGLMKKNFEPSESVYEISP